ncbi:hypothetical protein QJQ45_026586, partial [Haematococcus lacustris]
SDEPSRPLAEAQHEEQDPSAKAAAILDRAVRALEAVTQEVDSAAAAAAAALPHDSTPGPGPPAPGAVTPPPSGLTAAGVPRGGDATRAVLHRALLSQAAPGPPSQGSDHSDDGSKSTRPSPSEDSSRSSSSSSSSGGGGGGGGRGLGGRRADLRQAGPVPDLTSRGARAGPREGGDRQPSWAQALFGSGPLPARAPATSRPDSQPRLITEEMPMEGFLQLRSQESEELAAASRTQLPPLQSIWELTTAHQAPSRQGGGSQEAPPPAATPNTLSHTLPHEACLSSPLQSHSGAVALIQPNSHHGDCWHRAGEAVATEVAGEEAVAAPAPVGRQLADGQGVLADGTHWEKKSGEELGEGGFWKRWTLLKGWTEDGTVAFEECWWESSDWAGMKELGATKSGHTPSGKSHLTRPASHTP